MLADHLVRGAERPPDERRHAQDGEELRGHAQASRGGGLIELVAHPQVSVLECRQPVECRLHPPPVEDRSGCEALPPSVRDSRPLPSVSRTAARRSYSSNGRPRRATASTTEKTAVPAPMASARTPTAMPVLVGAALSRRRPRRTSMPMPPNRRWRRPLRGALARSRASSRRCSAARNPVWSFRFGDPGGQFVPVPDLRKGRAHGLPRRRALPQRLLVEVIQLARDLLDDAFGPLVVERRQSQVTADETLPVSHGCLPRRRGRRRPRTLPTARAAPRAPFSRPRSGGSSSGGVRPARSTQRPAMRPRFSRR